MLYLSGGPLAGQDQHTTARASLDRLYRQVTHAPAPPLEKALSGKPLFAQGSLFCSLTHTGQCAFCALSDYPVGLDAEPLNRPLSSQLARRILSPAEAAVFLQARDPQRVLLTYWVLKEAYVKYTGDGLRQDFRALAFDLSGPRPQLAAPSEIPLSFTLLQRHRHLLAVCSPGAELPVWQD